MRKVKNKIGLLLFHQPVDFRFQLAALRAAMNAAGNRQGADPGPDLGSCKLQRHDVTTPSQPGLFQELLRWRKPCSGFANTLEIGKKLVQLGYFQTVIDHRLRARHAQSASRAFQFCKATNQGTNGGAIHVSDTCHVKSHSRFPIANQFIHLLFQPRAFRAAMNASLDDQSDYARLNLLFRELQNHWRPPFPSSNGNCRIRRTQSPKAAKTELPQPQATNE